MCINRKEFFVCQNPRIARTRNARTSSARTKSPHRNRTSRKIRRKTKRIATSCTIFETKPYAKKATCKRMKKLRQFVKRTVGALLFG